MTRAETGNLARTAYFFEFFVYFVEIVVFGDLYFDAAFQIGSLFKCYLHGKIVCIFCLIFFSMQN